MANEPFRKSTPPLSKAASDSLLARARLRGLAPVPSSSSPAGPAGAKNAQPSASKAVAPTKPVAKPVQASPLPLSKEMDFFDLSSFLLDNKRIFALWLFISGSVSGAYFAFAPKLYEYRGLIEIGKMIDLGSDKSPTTTAFGLLGPTTESVTDKVKSIISFKFIDEPFPVDYTGPKVTEVATEPNTDLIRVSARGRTQQEAKRKVTEVLVSLQTQFEPLLTENIKVAHEMVQQLAQEVKTIEPLLAQIDGSIKEFGFPGGLLTSKLDLAGRLLSLKEAQRKITSDLSSNKVYNFRFKDERTAADVPVSPNPILVVVAALFFTLVFSGIHLVIRESRRRRRR